MSDGFIGIFFTCQRLWECANVVWKGLQLFYKILNSNNIHSWEINFLKHKEMLIVRYKKLSLTSDCTVNKLIVIGVLGYQLETPNR